MSIVTDHYERLLNLITTQFNNHPVIEAILQAFSNEMQDLEVALDDIAFLTALGLATGVQLDGLGEIVGEARKGRDDSDYRVAISIRIQINLSSGQPETLISVLSALTNATKVNLFELYPSGIGLETDGENLPNGLIDSIKAVMAAGVRLDYLVSVSSNPFTLFGDPEGQGFAEKGEASDYGGEISEKLVQDVPDVIVVPPPDPGEVAAARFEAMKTLFLHSTGIGINEQIFALAYDPTGDVVVAVGSPDLLGSLVMTTENKGLNWTRRTSTGGSTISLQSVIFDAGNSDLFIAVGGTTNVAHISTSADGVTWSAPTVPDTADDDFLSEVVSNGTIIVAVGGASSTTPLDLYTIRSVDGVTWARSSTPPTTAFATSALISLTWSGQNFVAGGQSGGVEYLITSTDGDTWTAQTLPVLNGAIARLASDGAGTVIGLTNSYIIVSTDHGVNWTRTVLPSTISVGSYTKIEWLYDQFVFYAMKNSTDKIHLCSTTDGMTINTYEVPHPTIVDLNGTIYDYVDVGDRVFVSDSQLLTDLLVSDTY